MSDASSKAATAGANPTASPEEVQALRDAQESEYSTYVAIAAISFNGSPAYLIGDPVPASNVKLHKYEEQGLVAKVNSATAQRAVSAIHEQALAGAAPVEQAAPVSLSVPVK